MHAYSPGPMSEDCANLRFPHRHLLGIEGLTEPSLTVVRQEGEGAGSAILEAEADSVASHRIYLRLPRAAVEDDTLRFTFTLTDPDSGEVARNETVFRGPKP